MKYLSTICRFIIPLTMTDLRPPSTGVPAITPVCGSNERPEQGGNYDQSADLRANKHLSAIWEKQQDSRPG